MRRTVVKARAALRLAVSITAFSLGFAALFFVGMLLNSLAEIIDKPFKALLYAGALFSVFGALYGTIVVLDESSGFRGRFGSLIRTFHYPKLRAGLGGLWGLFAVLLATHLVGRVASPTALLIGTVIGAILGWFGWRWAKYVDF